MHPVILIEHAGLILLGGYFLWGGLNHFRIFRHVRAMLAARGWWAPGTVLALGSLWEAGWGAVLASGYWTGWAVAALVAFVVAVNLTLFSFWDEADEDRREADLGAFMLNLGLIGGLMLAAALSVR